MQQNLPQKELVNFGSIDKDHALYKKLPIVARRELENRRANETGVKRIYKMKPSTIAYEFPDPAAEKPAKYKVVAAEPTGKVGDNSNRSKKTESLGDMLRRMKTQKNLEESKSRMEAQKSQASDENQFESKLAGKLQNKYRSVIKTATKIEIHPTVQKYRNLTSACSDLKDNEREKAVFYGQFLKQWTQIQCDRGMSPDRAAEYVSFMKNQLYTAADPAEFIRQQQIKMRSSVERLSPTKSPKHDPNASFELRVNDAEKKTVTSSLRSNRKHESDINLLRNKKLSFQKKGSLQFKHDTASLLDNGSLGAESQEELYAGRQRNNTSVGFYQPKQNNDYDNKTRLMNKRSSGVGKSLVLTAGKPTANRMYASSPMEKDNSDTLPDLAPPKFLSAVEQNQQMSRLTMPVNRTNTCSKALKKKKEAQKIRNELARKNRGIRQELKETMRQNKQITLVNDADSETITPAQLRKDPSVESIPAEIKLLDSIDTIEEPKRKKRVKKDPELTNKERVARQNLLLKQSPAILQQQRYMLTKNLQTQLQIFDNQKAVSKLSKKGTRQRIGHECSVACGCHVYLDSLSKVAPTLLGKMSSLTSYSQDISWMNVQSVKQPKTSQKVVEARGRNKRDFVSSSQKIDRGNGSKTASLSPTNQKDIDPMNSFVNQKMTKTFFQPRDPKSKLPSRFNKRYSSQQPEWDETTGNSNYYTKASVKQSSTVTRNTSFKKVNSNAYDHTEFGTGSVPSISNKNIGFSQPKLEIEKDIVITYGAKKTNLKTTQMSGEDAEVIGLLNQEEMIKSGDRFNCKEWGGLCNVMAVGNDFWMVREGCETSGEKCWKTRNGEGIQLASALNQTIKVLWENKVTVAAWMSNVDTICVKIEPTKVMEFKRL